MTVRSSRHWLAVAALSWLSITSADNGFAQSSNLVVNPAFSRDMPVPGWIGDHRDAWIRAHPVYHSSCQNREVMAEIRFLNRVIAYDEYLLSLTTASDPDNPTMERLANVAKQSAASLRRDITTVDALVAELRLLPGCNDGAEKTAKVSTLPARPMRDTTGPAPGSPHPAAEPAMPAATAPSAAISPPDTATDVAEPGRIVIRFDNRVAALTPSGIRAFDGAVNALRAGKAVQFAIDGCEPGADFTNGSPCARRLATLKQMLAENGIRDVKRLLGEIR
jgi:hypothetical protein